MKQSAIRYGVAIFAFSLGLGVGTQAAFAQGAELEFSGERLPTLRYDAAARSGLECVYVAYDTAPLRVSYRASRPDAKVVWRRFSNLGGGYAEDITDVVYDPDGSSHLNSVQGDCGYIVDDDGRQYCFWIVNYLPMRFSVQSVLPSSVRDCTATVLDVAATAAPIYYYDINGKRCELSREIEVDYESQEWDDEAQAYRNYAARKSLASIDKNVYITPPAYTHTAFRISGDRFLKAWQWGEEAESAVIPPAGIACRTAAVQQGSDASSDDASSDQGGATAGRDASNQIGGGKNEGLGGSAPVDITFTAYVTDGILHDEWQMSRSADFSDIEYRFTQRVLDYTFTDTGTYYLRYVGSNADGSCETVSDIYTVNIGSSELLCPNAFTPDGDGINDKWKVSYRSLITFDCKIFDRQGQLVTSFINPEDGWDGTRYGKPVGSGVYYYVIQAQGADGKTYKLAGDINILKRNVSGTKPQQ